MRPLIIYALTTSATFLAFSDSAIAKECPPLNVSEITVIDPNKDIALRTDPAIEKQNIPGSKRGHAVINHGETLLIDKKTDPKDQSGICFYPVEINQSNNSSNTEQSVISYKPYWISEKGIQDYSALIFQKRSPIQTLFNNRNIGNDLFPWQLIFSQLLLLAVGLGIFKLSEWNKKNNYVKEKKKSNQHYKKKPTNLSSKPKEANPPISPPLDQASPEKEEIVEVPSPNIENIESQGKNLTELQQTIHQLKSELDALKKLVANPTPISADAYHPLLNNSATHQIIELPLSRVIDLYRECPEILQAYAQRVSIDKKHFSLDGNTNTDQPLTFQATPNGNFWVIQLQKQGSFLFPRPNDIKRMNRLSMLDKIFELDGNNNEPEAEFDVVLPAKLAVTRLQTNWRLKEKGELSYVQIPLNYQWQKELTSIRQQQEAITRQMKDLAEQNLSKQYKDLHKEFRYFCQETLSEFERLRSTTQTQQETINFLLANQKSTKLENTAPENVLTDLAWDLELLTKDWSLNPFYDEVISQFNTGSVPWFSSQIQQQTFMKVQMTLDSVLGQMDMGRKVHQLELNEWGTLLIYQAGDKFWAIPDQTQSKWKRAITDSLFISNGQTLVRPAELVLVSNNLWQLVEKGEFSE